LGDASRGADSSHAPSDQRQERGREALDRPDDGERSGYGDADNDTSAALTDARDAVHEEG